MKSILTGTFAALVLGAAVASSQTPPAAQAPSPTPAAPPAGQTQPSGQDQQRTATAKGQTYRGVLKGSAASGWTLTPVANRSAASPSSTAGATATAGGAAEAVTYSVVVAEGSKTNLESMADECVEIVGIVAPTAASAGSPSAGAAADAAGAAAKRVLTVTTIKEVEGGCKQ